jgi:HSP20 family protein
MDKKQGQQTTGQSQNVPITQAGQAGGQARGQGQSGAQRPNQMQSRQPSQSIERGGEQRLRGYGGGYGGVSPFGLVRQMMEDMDRMFSELGGRGLTSFDESPFGSGRALATSMPQIWAPEVEVLQKDDSLIVRADLPGLNENDVRVHIDEDALTIEGERKTEHESEREGVYHSERSYGSFQRRIALPRGIDASSCDASFENGVLEVKMKLPAASKRTVQIRSGQAGGRGSLEQGQAQAQQAPTEGQTAQTGSAEPRRNGGNAPQSRH